MLILAAGIFAAGVLWLALRAEIPLCPFRHVTGIPCPGCGGTRVLGMLLHSFQHAERTGWAHHAVHIWGDALQINPLAVVLVLAGAAGSVWLIVDIVRGTDGFLSFFERVFRRRWPTWAACAAVAAVFLNWLWVIRQHFM